MRIYQSINLLPHLDDSKDNEPNYHSSSGGPSPFWYRMNRNIIRLCSTHQFKNLQVEMLYQRYFLRMNQSNTAHIVSLLLGLVLLLATIHVVFALSAPKAGLWHSSPLLINGSVIRTATAHPLNGSAIPKRFDYEDDQIIRTNRVTNDSFTANLSLNGAAANSSQLLYDDSSGLQRERLDIRDEQVEEGEEEDIYPAISHLTSSSIWALIITLVICGIICICEYIIIVSI